MTTLLTSSSLPLRRVKDVFTASRHIEGEGFVVRRPIGGTHIDYCDPFLMLDHFGPKYCAPGEAKGTPDHPHRGFETVSYILDGDMRHLDSLGNSGFISAGGVQWMTAGSGIIHKEGPTEEFLRAGGNLEGFQLWVNLPSKDKMIRPRYQDTPPEDLPTLLSKDGNVFVKIITGSTSLDGKEATSPIETRFPILYIDVRLKSGKASFETVLPGSFNGFVYCYRGKGSVNGKPLIDGQAALFDGPQTVDRSLPSDRLLLTSSDSDEMRALVIFGEPIGEPIAKYGPFVMTTEEQLKQAFRDYRSGDFGKINLRSMDHGS